MRILAALLLLALPLAGCTGAPPPTAGDAPGPAWSFTDTEGREHSNATAAGQPSVLFFMASWCGSCRQNAPRLAAAHRDYGERAGFYTIAFDRTDTVESLEAWKAQYASPWPHGIDGSFSAAKNLSIVAQSSIVVLDAQGQVAQRWGYGGANEADLRAALDRALAG